MATRTAKNSSPTGLRITRRDLAAAWYVYKYRFLTARHLSTLLEAGGNFERNRLAALYRRGRHGRILDRLERDSTSKAIYALGDAGYRLLRAEESPYRQQIKPLKSSWRQKNREVKRPTHKLRINDVMVPLEVSLRRYDELEAIEFSEIVAGAPPAKSCDRTSSGSRTWNVPIQQARGRTRLYTKTPDETFGLRRLDVPKKRSRYHYFLEVDLATEPTERATGMSVSCYYRHARLYYESYVRWRRNPKHAPYGFTHGRVLTVTTSRARLKNLVARSIEASRGKATGLFLFATFEEIAAAEDMLALPWTSATGKTVRLLDV